MGAAFDPPSADGDYFGVFVAPYMNVGGRFYASVALEVL